MIRSIAFAFVLAATPLGGCAIFHPSPDTSAKITALLNAATTADTLAHTVLDAAEAAGTAPDLVAKAKPILVKIDAALEIAKTAAKAEDEPTVEAQAAAILVLVIQVQQLFAHG